MSSHTTGVEINHGSVNQDALLDNSRMSDDMDISSSEGFLEYFEELDEYGTAIRTDHCCSNCNPEFELNKPDQFYLYYELDSGVNNRTKQVLEALEEWSKEQMLSVYKRCAFRPVSTIFLPQDQRDKIARNVHLIFDMDSLQTVLGSWYFFDTHGQALFDIVRNSYRQAQAGTNSQQAVSSQLQGLGPDSQAGPSTTQSAKRPAPESIPHDITKRRQTGKTGYVPTS
jgi:hypothetical protein